MDSESNSKNVTRVQQIRRGMLRTRTLTSRSYRASDAQPLEEVLLPKDSAGPLSKKRQQSTPNKTDRRGSFNGTPASRNPDRSRYVTSELRQG